MRGRSMSIIPSKPGVASFAKHPGVIIKSEIYLRRIRAIVSRKIVSHRESIIIRYRLGSLMQKLIAVEYGVVTQRESFMSKDRVRSRERKIVIGSVRWWANKPMDSGMVHRGGEVVNGGDTRGQGGKLRSRSVRWMVWIWTGGSERVGGGCTKALRISLMRASNLASSFFSSSDIADHRASSLRMASPVVCLLPYPLAIGTEERLKL
ncbi:LOW QUALITY PROTEIN: hypothetical protein TorRG33x02_096850 [Trema orientale]|uniref:Uncharacterized protein n=1 Tax=Trema orientale TaxID=63057 RepID=A0A2P5F9H9_TREOI|nr:LOW QUALITY PROTEIN: hypothetical protein TorRG33x02_096850 [Trema orientale]